MDVKPELIDELEGFYFEHLDTKGGKGWATDVRRQLRDFLSEDYDPDLIKESIIESIGSPDNYRVILRNKKKESGTESKGKTHELIQKDVFYFHPYLQVVPPPPILEQDPKTGELRQTNQVDFYLKNKESFTLQDALDFFYEKFPDFRQYKDRDIAALKFMLERDFYPAAERANLHRKEAVINGLDLYLYTVIEARELIHENDGYLKSMFNITKYLEDGLYLYEERIHNAKLNGLDKPC